MHPLMWWMTFFTLVFQIVLTHLPTKCTTKPTKRLPKEHKEDLGNLINNAQNKYTLCQVIYAEKKKKVKEEDLNADLVHQVKEIAKTYVFRPKNDCVRLILFVAVSHLFPPQILGVIYPLVGLRSIHRHSKAIHFNRRLVHNHEQWSGGLTNNDNIVKVKAAMKSSSDDMNDSSDSPSSSSSSSSTKPVSSLCTTSSSGVTKSVVPSSPPSEQTDQMTLSDTMEKDENHNKNTSNGNDNDNGNGNGNGNNNNSTTTLREKEMHFIEAKVREKSVDKVADMCTFGLYGTVTGVRDVAKALREEKEKCDQQNNEEEDGGGGGGKHTLTWGHAAYVAANAWTDGGVDIAEEVYEKEAKIWKEKHPYKKDCDQKPSQEEDEKEKGEGKKVEIDCHIDDDVGNEEQ